MPNKQLFRVYLAEKITATVEEMFDAFESAVAAEYEEEISRSKKENNHLRRLLDMVIKPEIKLHRSDFHHPVSVEDVSEQLPHREHELGPIQEDPEPTPVIKQEVDLGSPPGGEPSQGLESSTNDTICVQPSYLYHTASGEDAEREALPNTTTSSQIKMEPDGAGDRVSQPTRGLKRITAGDPYGFTSQSENSESAKGVEGGRCKSLQVQRTRRATRLSCRMSSEGRTPIEVSNLKSDIKTEEPLYNCRVCGGTLDSLDSLISHVSIHSKNKECLCGVCGKRFEFTQSLGDHLQTHRGENPHCFVCGKYFTCNYDLEVHMRVHTDTRKVTLLYKRIHNGQRAVRCLECRNGFSSVYALQTHQQTHTKVKRHCCHHCGKCFSQSGHLTEHLRIHTGEKPYSCHVCGKRFTRSFSVKTHLGIKHHVVEEVVPSTTGETPYRCRVCGKGFRYHACLKTHAMKHT